MGCDAVKFVGSQQTCWRSLWAGFIFKVEAYTKTSKKQTAALNMLAVCVMVIFLAWLPCILKIDALCFSQTLIYFIIYIIS
jgi:hypothetical protein